MAEALELSSEEMEIAAHNILSSSQEFSVPEENSEGLNRKNHLPVQRSASSGAGDPRLANNRRMEPRAPL